MLRIFMGKRFFLFFGLVLVGAVCGLAIAGRLNVAPAVNAGAPDKAAVEKTVTGEIDIRNAFIKVSESIGPAVVSISSERIHKIPGRKQFYFGPGNRGDMFGDDFFDDFFKDFFGQIPEREYKQMGLGSGVIIDAEGYILTNEHVISGATKITVTLPDGRSFEAKIKGTDPRSDLAIIKIEAKKLPSAELGDSDLIQTGEWVVAIGNPFGYAVNNPTPTVTVGVVSAVHRALPGFSDMSGGEKSYLDLIQTDAAINPGNSGGPLCDLDGKIVGINVAIMSTTGGYQGVGFAIPSNLAKGVIGDLIKGKKIVYGWMGVAIQEMTDDLAKFFGLPGKTGVLVSEVLKDGPAQKAQVRDGDIILKIDNEDVKTVRDVLRKVNSKKPGEKVELLVLREKQQVPITVVVGERPAEKDEFMGQQEEKPEAKEDIVWRGINVIDITPEIARENDLGDVKGVIVVNVAPGSPAFEIGLGRGDIITEINRMPVRSKAEFNKIVGKIKGDALIRTDKGYVVIKEEEK